MPPAPEFFVREPSKGHGGKAPSGIVTSHNRGVRMPLWPRTPRENLTDAIKTAIIADDPGLVLILISKSSRMRFNPQLPSLERSRLAVDKKIYRDYPTSSLFGHLHGNFGALAYEGTLECLSRAQCHSLVCVTVKSQVLQVPVPGNLPTAVLQSKQSQSSNCSI